MEWLRNREGYESGWCTWRRREGSSEMDGEGDKGRRKRLKYLKSAGYDSKTIIFCFEIILPWQLITTVHRYPILVVADTQNTCLWLIHGRISRKKVIHISFDIVRVHGQRRLTLLYFVDVRCTIVPAICRFVCVYTVGNQKNPSNRSLSPRILFCIDNRFLSAFWKKYVQH